MRRPVSITLLTLSAIATLPAWAQQGGVTPHRYRWTDSHGVVQYGDSPSAEALRVGYEVIDGRGMVVKRVDRVKTAAEKKAEASVVDAAAQEKQRAIDARQADAQLLQAYPSEDALIAVQKMRLVAIDQDIANVKVSQADQEKNLAEQLAYAATFERDSKPVPAATRQQIESLRVNIDKQKKFIADDQAKRAAVEKKSADEFAHYRELRAARAKAQE
ncbi:MAG: DUF4124 domain-containing protein [Proteobacteria bacterium]|nr:DUF4124 domain-containing protein [Pseudomonadota bacterium]